MNRGGLWREVFMMHMHMVWFGGGKLIIMTPAEKLTDYQREYKKSGKAEHFLI